MHGLETEAGVSNRVGQDPKANRKRLLLSFFSQSWQSPGPGLQIASLGLLRVHLHDNSFSMKCRGAVAFWPLVYTET